MSDKPIAPAALSEAIPHACSIVDVARFLNHSPQTIRRMLARHELPLVELESFGGHRRFAGRSVAAILAGRHAAPRARGDARHT